MDRQPRRLKSGALEIGSSKCNKSVAEQN